MKSKIRKHRLTGPYDTRALSTARIPNNPESTLVHEVVGHGHPMAYGENPINPQKREIEAVTVKNEYRASKGLLQLPDYVNKNETGWDIPQF
jgi:hypothetical protein